MLATLRYLTDDIWRSLETIGTVAFPETSQDEVKVDSKNVSNSEGKLDPRLMVIENGACVGCTAPGSTEAQVCDYCGRGKDRK